MPHTHCLLLLLAGLLVLSSSQPAPKPDNTSNGTCRGSSQCNNLGYKIAPSNANFAFRLYHLTVLENPGQNVFFSPLSISIALAMLSLGAGGDTQTQILEGLGFNLTKLSRPQIHEGFRIVQDMISRPATDLHTNVGNALILSQDLQLLPEFANATKASYNSEVLRTNFRDTEATIQLINNYVKEKTHGKIKNLVRTMSPDVRMVLVNYIFFRGEPKRCWATEEQTLLLGGGRGWAGGPRDL